MSQHCQPSRYSAETGGFAGSYLLCEGTKLPKMLHVALQDTSSSILHMLWTQHVQHVPHCKQSSLKYMRTLQREGVSYEKSALQAL